MSYIIAHIGACVNPKLYVWLQNVGEHFALLYVIR